MTIELREGGEAIPVTEENKSEYVECVLLTIDLLHIADTPLVC